jgi:pSer/pThr/pTyr-binding forkhead associated (FHA) protein
MTAPGDQVFLEDLGSKNGTFLQGSRVVSQERLADGDVIQIGSVELKFRVWSATNAVETDRIRTRGRQAARRRSGQRDG